MKISANILIPGALLALLGCSEPKKDNVVDVRPGAPLFPSAPTGTAQPGAAATGANVNPPHGQPGHNCAVPVGAPLTTAPASGINATPAVTPGSGSTASPAGPIAAPGAPTPVPAQVQVAAGTNPPHGQPGHDCSIPVGAPLKTK
jgi:hypothetical protein